jgi:hypothetical protein
VACSQGLLQCSHGDRIEARLAAGEPEHGNTMAADESHKLPPVDLQLGRCLLWRQVRHRSSRFSGIRTVDAAATTASR